MTEAARVVPLSEAGPTGPTLAVGDFDGVHGGHRAVVAGADAVLSLRPTPDGGRLTPTRLEAELMAELDVATLVVDDLGICTGLDGRRWVSDVLVAQLGARTIRLPEDFEAGTFAAHAAALHADQRLATVVVPGERDDGRLVTGAWIRELVAEGRVAQAAKLLGRPHRLSGNVARGDRRGRTLGFPTANLPPPEDAVCPEAGVYACRANGRPAAVSVGLRPTFDGTPGLLVEAHILDFVADLYGAPLRIEFVERLRGERAFDGPGALVAQIRRDIEDVRAALAAAARLVA